MATKKHSTRLYLGQKVGCKNYLSEKCYEIFRTSKEPTEASHGHKYSNAIGPFRTKLGAEVMLHARGSPTIQTVSDAEKIAKGIKEGKRVKFW
jgi:hypothetical protein